MVPVHWHNYWQINLKTLRSGGKSVLYLLKSGKLIFWHCLNFLIWPIDLVCMHHFMICHSIVSVYKSQQNAILVQHTTFWVATVSRKVINVMIFICEMEINIFKIIVIYSMDHYIQTNLIVYCHLIIYSTIVYNVE